MASVLIRENAGSATDHFRSDVRIAHAIGPQGFSALAYKCLLNEDNDGAPNCYGPLDNPPSRPLDALRNATNHEDHVFAKGSHGFLWHGLYAVTKTEAAAHTADYGHDTDERLESSDHKFPVVQKAGATKGFYVSTTSILVNGALNKWDPNRYLNAAAFSYGAITPPLEDLGANQGDLGLAVRADKPLGKPFFFGDAGAQQKVGEVSRNLFRAFFPAADQENHPVIFIVFPGVQASSMNAPDLESAVRTQIAKLGTADNPDHLARFLTLPAHLTGPAGDPPIQETLPADGSVSQIEQLRNALRTPYQRAYLNLMWVLHHFGLPRT